MSRHLSLLIAAASCVFTAPAADRCDSARDLRLVNGKIHTMDARDTVVSSVTIQDGRFVVDGQKLDPCTKTINLRGRTAVPGLIDNHNHIVLLGLRPGYDTRLETAARIADVQALIREHSFLPGGFLTPDPLVNVLELNLALNERSPAPHIEPPAASSGQ